MSENLPDSADIGVRQGKARTERAEQADVAGEGTGCENSVKD